MEEARKLCEGTYKKSEHSMAAFAANEAGSSPFSSSERVTILSMLEEYTNALAIYHSMLKKPTRQDNDILVNCISFHSIHTEYAKEDNVSEKLYEEKLVFRININDNDKCSEN